MSSNEYPGSQYSRAVSGTVSPYASQQEGIKLQVQGYIKDLAKVQLPEVSGVRSLNSSDEFIHNQIPHRGPFESTQDFPWDQKAFPGLLMG